jgi:enoyl-CoA hydratase/carnithine racemase
MIDIEHLHGLVVIHLRKGNHDKPLPDVLDGLTAALDYAGDRPVVLLARDGIPGVARYDTDTTSRVRFASALRRAVDAVVGHPFPVIAAFGGKPADVGHALAAVADLRVTVPGGVEFAEPGRRPAAVSGSP